VQVDPCIIFAVLQTALPSVLVQPQASGTMMLN
jgi:hypothetical protein